MLGNTSLLLYAACVSLLVSPSLATFNITSKENVVVYYVSLDYRFLAAHCAYAVFRVKEVARSVSRRTAEIPVSM